MQIFVTGTGTDAGKTIVCSWMCLHSRADYFKPVQTGTSEGTDSDTVRSLSGVRIFPESVRYPQPLSPHLAASLCGEVIDENKIMLPASDHLIIEGAGGLMVPLNQKTLMIDLIASMQVPVILVAKSALGTINHTLLSLMALRDRKIPVLGVIVTGPANRDNCAAIRDFGAIPILAELPQMTTVSRGALQKIPLTAALKKILEPSHDTCRA